MGKVKTIKELFDSNITDTLDKYKHSVKELNKRYIGFVVKRPLKEAKIGRTILKRYPSETKNRNIRYLNVFSQNSIHLFGRTLEINTLPYQEQDNAVSACATIALWTSLQALGYKFNKSSDLSPSEITSLAFESNSIISSRKYPNNGLTMYQIISTLRELGYEVTPYFFKNDSEKNLLKGLIRTYVNFGIPLLVGLELTKRNREQDYHAVVITGFKENTEKEIIQLYVHDDQIGPFCKVKLKDGNIFNWENEWTERRGYVSMKPMFLFVPIYHKIRLSFTRVSEICNALMESLREYNFSKEILLFESNDYKESVLKYFFKNKTLFFEEEGFKTMKRMLQEQYPHYIWVIRLYKDNKRFADYVLDSTTNIIDKPLCVIKY